MAKKLKKSFRKELKQPDEFVSTSVQVLEWLNARKYWLVGGGVGFVLIGAVSWGVVSWLESGQEKASTALVEALDVLSAKVEPAKEKTEDEAPPVEPENPDEKTFPTHQEKLTAARDALTKLKTEYEGSAAADLATLMLAQTEQRLGEHAQALQELDGFVKRTSHDDELRQLAIEAQAYVHEEEGRLDQAIEKFTAMTQGGPVFMGDFGYFNAARLYEKTGKKDRAMEQYDALLKDYPASELKGKVDARLLELRGPPVEKPADALKPPEGAPAP